jgi:hypothetical protein
MSTSDTSNRLVPCKKRSREEEKAPEEPEEQQPTPMDKEEMKKKILSDNTTKYMETMKKYHTTEVGEKSKFDRKCAIILEELVNAYHMQEKGTIFDKVTEYYKLKCDYDLFMTNMTCIKRILREKHFPSFVKEEDRYKNRSLNAEYSNILEDLRASTSVIYKSQI